MRVKSHGNNILTSAILQLQFVLFLQVHEGISSFHLFEKTLKKVEFPEENILQALPTLKFGPSLLNKQVFCYQNDILVTSFSSYSLRF